MQFTSILLAVAAATGLVSAQNNKQSTTLRSATSVSTRVTATSVSTRVTKSNNTHKSKTVVPSSTVVPTAPNVIAPAPGNATSTAAAVYAGPSTAGKPATNVLYSGSETVAVSVAAAAVVALFM
ncbi:hypothetical protein HDU79_009802 [Rhizoclosmatium sp. JEL0117]|nr:hypothetical protein HDU79_009802 [Rhizoclosmatium sp. JEL0117]